MKKVLFLAPNYKYIRTTVTGITKDLTKRKIQFTTNIPGYLSNRPDPKKGSELYLRTSNVEVIFNYDDPVTWSIETLAGVDAVFGKKELVETMRENFPTRVVKRTGSVQRYIVEHALNTPVSNIIIDDIHPVKTKYIPSIKNVYFNDPMTIVLWDDGTKTMVKCQEGDVYSEEVGLAICIAKKSLGNQGNFNNVFKKWIPEPEVTKVSNISSVIVKSDAFSDRVNLLERIVDDLRHKICGTERT